MDRKIPSNWKNCATCVCWTGRQMTDNFCMWVEFDGNEQAKCMGGGWHLCNRTGMNTCNKWVQRFKR